MKIFTTAIIKGGTGKTTTAAALAQAAAADKKKVLAIDLDPQGNLSFYLAADKSKAGAVELLQGTPAAETIQTTPQGIDIIAARGDLAAEETTTGSTRRLQEALQPIKKNYDIIIIDTPPQMGELVFNGLQAAEGIIIPVEADSGSLAGIYNLAELIEATKRTNKGLKVAGVIVTRYDNRAKINQYLKDTIKEKSEAEGFPYLMEIRQGIAVKEALQLQQALYKYAPKSKPAADYRKLLAMLTK